MVGRDSIFQAMRSARVLGDIAADRAGALARRIRSEEQSLPRREL